MALATETIDGSSGGLYSKVITRKYQTTGDAKEGKKGQKPFGGPKGSR